MGLMITSFKKAFTLRSLLFALAGFVIACPVAADAQIQDDAQSTNFLAVQCAMSSGRSAADFEEYGRKLAETVAHLSPGQQKRVFGYVPQPILFAKPAEALQMGEPSPSFAAADWDSSANAFKEVYSSSAPTLEVGSAAVVPGGEAASGSILENEGELSAQGETDAKTGSDWWSNAVKWLDSAVDKIIEDFAEWQQS